LSTNIPTPRPNARNIGILFLGEGVLDVTDNHTENSLVLNLPPERGVKGLLRFPGDLIYFLNSTTDNQISQVFYVKNGSPWQDRLFYAHIINSLYREINNCACLTLC
jgi:hypothetical protein